MSGPAPTPDSLSTELRRLEEIVRQLESDDPDLDRALALFEEGIGRLRSAREQLALAETRIQKVLQDTAGEIRLKEVD
jgi:exodeoxyribonuclease VII small subunit